MTVAPVRDSAAGAPHGLASTPAALSHTGVTAIRPRPMQCIAARWRKDSAYQADHDAPCALAHRVSAVPAGSEHLGLSCSALSPSSTQLPGKHPSTHATQQRFQKRGHPHHTFMHAILSFGLINFVCKNKPRDRVQTGIKALVGCTPPEASIMALFGCTHTA